ncbi:MAG: DUF1853 family protein [Pseudomonadota bacterium]|nr:DUF1853 family protein [Pseudomonadota bacterium]
MLANFRSEPFQAKFHARWHALRDPHVRALAWLLDAPDLLDPAAPQWQGKLASIPVDDRVREWLFEQDSAPAALHTFLALGPFERLGRYAEKLLAFYFQQRGLLVAHGVQIRTEKKHTVGEFDFLLRDGADLLHWEFATKLYLQEGSADGDHFVGPNLADSLCAKMAKILQRQLALGQHPAAQAQLPQPIARAQALIKGWLFYHGNEHPAAQAGLHRDHCRGWWCASNEIDALPSARFVILARLAWLAPLQATRAQTRSHAELKQALDAHFAEDAMPVMVAILTDEASECVELSRGFVVPDDWRARAGQRAQRSFIAAR